MKEDEAYIEIANRYIDSCEKHIASNVNLQEVFGFESYHAFESVGGALVSHFGGKVPRQHPMKINEFVTSSNRNHLANRKAIATLAMMLSSLRNKFLYPAITNGAIINPKDQISISDAKKLVKRVRGVIRSIEGII